MTISVPCLWNSIQRSLDSRQSLGSSSSPRPPCGLWEGPRQVTDGSGARVTGAPRLASAGGKVRAENSGGPATRAPARGTLPGANGPEMPRMMSTKGAFYARDEIQLGFSSVSCLRRIPVPERLCLLSVRVQTASGPVRTQRDSHGGRSLPGAACVITRESGFKPVLKHRSQRRARQPAGNPKQPRCFLCLAHKLRVTPVSYFPVPKSLLLICSLILK